MGLITSEEFLEKYKVTQYRITRYIEKPYQYRVEFFDPLIDQWQQWGDFMTLREAKRALRFKRRDERRYIQIVKRHGMQALHDEWCGRPVVYEYKDKEQNEHIL